MIDLMWKETVEQGTKIINKGDLNADYFYVVMEGSFEVQLENNAQSLNARVSANIEGTLSEGQSFGELALMYSAPRAATIMAKTKATVMILDRLQFKKILE